MGELYKRKSADAFLAFCTNLVVRSGLKRMPSTYARRWLRCLSEPNTRLTSATSLLWLLWTMMHFGWVEEHLNQPVHALLSSQVCMHVSQLSGFTSDPRELCSCLYDLETNVCESFSILWVSYTSKANAHHTWGFFCSIWALTVLSRPGRSSECNVSPVLL